MKPMAINASLHGVHYLADTLQLERFGAHQCIFDDCGVK